MTALTELRFFVEALAGDILIALTELESFLVGDMVGDTGRRTGNVSTPTRLSITF